MLRSWGGRITKEITSFQHWGARKHSLNRGMEIKFLKYAGWERKVHRIKLVTGASTLKFLNSFKKGWSVANATVRG